MKFGHLKLKSLDSKFKYVLFDSLNDAASLVKQEPPPYPFALFVAADEISAIIPSIISVKANKEEPNWTCIRVIGEMPFGTVQGLIAQISNALISEGVGLCAISTFKTDWFFIKQNNLDKSIAALKKIGWEFI